MSISQQRRDDIIDALRRGTVPQYGLDALAVGLAPFEGAFDGNISYLSEQTPCILEEEKPLLFM